MKRVPLLWEIWRDLNGEVEERECRCKAPVLIEDTYFGPTGWSRTFVTCASCGGFVDEVVLDAKERWLREQMRKAGL